MFRVLIPSICITNSLTLNLSPSFRVTRSFPIPLEMIKRSGDVYFDMYKSSQSNGLVLNISTATEKNGDFTGEILTSFWSIPKWVEPIFVYIFVYAIVIMFYMLYICLSRFSWFSGCLVITISPIPGLGQTLR